MKWTTFVLVISLVHISSAGFAQITLKEKNAPLEKVLAVIEKQTKYVFLYDPDDLKTPLITISIKNATLQETLEKVFKGLPVEFTVIGNNVLLKKKHSEDIKKTAVANVSITGNVIDENGRPLSDVTVVNKRRGNGTETDSSGVFIIMATKGDVLGVSHVGYKGKEAFVADERYLNIVLELNASGPEQVVVIGYGSSRKRDLTGAVSVVDVKGMDEVPFNTVDNALAGKAPGVEIIKTDGTPGGMVRVRIRGSSSLLGGNDPLYVIDGVPVQIRSNFIEPGFKVKSPNANLVGSFFLDVFAALPGSYVNSLNTLGTLDPDDIASMTILKDASSAAIYGSKAANGVIIITTKTGKTATPPRMEVSWSSTFSSPYKTPRLLNASQYKTLLTEAAKNTFIDDSIGPAHFVDALTNSVLKNPSFFGTANTNWIRQVTRTTLSNHIRLSIDGGGQTSKYYGSIAAGNTPGVVDGTNYRRISGKFNVETRVGSKLRFASSLLAGLTDQKIGAGTYAQALLAMPDLEPRDASGNFTNFDLRQSPQGTEYGFINPVALSTATNNGKTFTFLGSFSGSYVLSKSLTFRSAVSLNRQNYSQRNYFPHYIDVDVDGFNYPFSSGVSSEANSRFANWFLENTLNYTRQFNEKHAVNFVMGQSYESTKYSYSTATGAGYRGANLTNVSAADTILFMGGSEPPSPQSYLLSFYARTNYSYRDKYFFTFTGRADGSSKFGSDKFGYFPSGAVAWRISRETFLKSTPWLNDLKVRASYGLTGNQNIGEQTKHTLYNPVTYNGSNGLIPTALGNEKILPESTKETDIGLDLSLFTDRLYAVFDFYNRQTGNAILTLPVAGSSAYSVLTQNAAGIRNRGFEAGIGGDIIRNRNFKWSASIHATWNSSLVTRLNSNADLRQIVSPSGFENVGSSASANSNLYWANSTLVQGKPLGLIMGYFITGIIKTQAELAAYNQQTGPPQISRWQLGDPMFKLTPSKTSSNQVFQSNVILAHGAPTCYGGMTQEFGYKNFDLQCFFTFSAGGHLLWAEHSASVEFYGLANANRSMLNRYTPTHTNTDAPRLDFHDGPYNPTNLDVFGSSYFKLRSLILNYRVDQGRWMTRMAIKNMQLFLSVTNVFTLTKYPGSDPETSDDAYIVSGGYIDAGNYPAVRTYTLGLKASF